jgi:hypothetical protein
MAKVMTLQGTGGDLGAPADKCKCVYNTRTKRGARLCFVGKGPRTRSGWIFKPGSCTPPRK